MHPTTRSRILDILRKQQTATVRELSRTLIMTGANVRHHLAVLESNDLIELVSQRQEGRGRPENVYGLSRRILGEGLKELAVAVFDIWLRDKKGDAFEASLKSLALQLGGEDLPNQMGPLSGRLTRAVNQLNEKHYQARWEASKDGARIILGNCPYSAIIAFHPELCRMDAILLEQRTCVPVEQTDKLQPSAKGYPFCSFHVIGGR